MRSLTVVAGLFLVALSCTTSRIPQSSVPVPESMSSVASEVHATGVMAPELQSTAANCLADTGTEQQSEAKSRRRWLWIALAAVAAAVVIYLIASNDDGGYSPPGFAVAAPQVVVPMLSRAPPIACGSP